MDTYATLNEVLVNLFRDVVDIEQNAIANYGHRDITYNDMHVIAAIGVDEPKNMSAIAKTLSVTVGTLTIAMNSLVKKGYVVRERGREDKRVVYISLSEKGKIVYDNHMEFHRGMIDSIINQLDEDEKEALLSALGKLNVWFRSYEKK